MVLDYRFDDLNTASKLARAVLQQREQIAHDISPLMSKLQNHRFKFDLELKEKRTIFSHASIHAYSLLAVSIPAPLTHGFRDQKLK